MMEGSTTVSSSTERKMETEHSSSKTATYTLASSMTENLMELEFSLKYTKDGKDTENGKRVKEFLG